MAMDEKMLRDLLTWFGLRFEWALATDSSAARGMSLRQGVGKVRRLDARALWVQQATRLLGLRVLKCKGTENPSDIGKKSRAAEVHEQLCKQVGLRRLAGELGSIREVEVNALIRKSQASVGGASSCCPTLKSAILALFIALQARQGDAVPE